MAITPAAIGLAIIFKPVFNFTPQQILLFIPALLLAFIIRFTTGYTLGLAASWFNRVQALNSTYFVVFLFFSGRLTPIQLLPRSLQIVADILPFKYALGFPIELLLGRLNSAEIAQGLTIQLIWSAICLFLLRTVWNRGVRKYAAFGS